MWLGSSVATTPGSIRVTRTSGSSSWRRDSDQPLSAPLGRCVDAVAGARGAAGDRGDVDDVPAALGGAVLELVEEDLGGGDRAEQVDLDHLPVVGALVGGEGAEQHHAGVVDQDVRATELLLDALGGGDDAVAVGDVGLDRDGAVAELVSDGGDAVDAAGEERDAVAARGEGARGGLTDAGGGAGDDGDACVVVGVGHDPSFSVVWVRAARGVRLRGSVGRSSRG